MSTKENEVALRIAQGVLVLMRYRLEEARILELVKAIPASATPDQVDEWFEQVSAAEIAAGRATSPLQ